MGSSFVIGSKQVSSAELQEKHALGEVQQFQQATDPQAKLTLSAGVVTKAQAVAPPPQTPAFTPIGIGKPLSIEILTVYTGDAPAKKIFGQAADLLVVSAVKAVETFAAQARAINQLVPKIGDNQYLEPSALTEGSTIVYYSPSMVDDTTLCSFEMVTDRFDTEIFGQVASLFKKAAGLPIFAPQSTYLLAGSFLIRAAAKLANSLIDTGPFMRADLNLRFDTPGMPVALAHSAVLYDDRNQNELVGYEVRYVGDALKLVNPGSGSVYQGDSPYLIVSLDGRERDELKDFSPTVAKAALLEKFYGSGDPGGAVLDAIGSALELYNDSESRQKALDYKGKLDQLNQQLAGLDPRAIDFGAQKQQLLTSLAEANKRYDAWRGRIQNQVFQLPAAEEGPSKGPRSSTSDRASQT